MGLALQGDLPCVPGKCLWLDTRWECGTEGPWQAAHPSVLRSHDLTCAWGGVSFFHMEPFHTPANSPGPQLITFYFYFFAMLRLDAHTL